MAAIIKFKNGRKKFVPFSEGLKIWRWKYEDADMTEKQRRYAEMIDDIYLDRHKAPDSYLAAHHDIIQRLPAKEPYKRQLKLMDTQVMEERYG